MLSLSLPLVPLVSTVALVSLVTFASTDALPTLLALLSSRLKLAFKLALIESITSVALVALVRFVPFATLTTSTSMMAPPMLKRHRMRPAAASKLNAEPLTLTSVPPRVGPSEGLTMSICGCGASPNDKPSDV